jgi:hypothetical protein
MVLAPLSIHPIKIVLSIQALRLFPIQMVNVDRVTRSRHRTAIKEISEGISMPFFP